MTTMSPIMAGDACEVGMTTAMAPGIPSKTAAAS
jgi:hypothetical protein